jgi:isoquinoline 1-oxidoreductase beta subunit
LFWASICRNRVTHSRQFPPIKKFLKPNAWVRITLDNQITIITEVPELGQGTRTANVMMLADELEVEWSNIHWEQAPTVPAVYKYLNAGGSSGMTKTYLPMRRAGAQARELLLKAAAQQWGVEKGQCRAETGAVIHSPSGRRLSYGELVKTASKLPTANLGQVPLRDLKDFRFIGKAMARVDTPGKVDGSATFGIDVRVPEMLFAVIARCPRFGGRASAWEDVEARATPGVKSVFPVPSIGYVPEIGTNLNVAGGIAVVADSTWAAFQGRKALKITWDKSAGEPESTASLQKQFIEKAGGAPTVVNHDRGNAIEGLSRSAKKVEANYEIPFQAHATMEPMNTTVHVRGDGHIEVWSPTQIANIAQTEIAQLAGVPPENVLVNLTLSGGSFGRRYQWDYLAEAYLVAKEIKVPVQLVWSREDDLQHDFYLQYSYQRLAAGLDPAGNILAWSHRIVSTPIRAVFDSPELLKDPKHVASYDVIGTIPYQALNYRSDYAPVLSAVPRAWWRSVSSPFQVFAVECFVDELAHAAGQDPLEFRMKLLEPAGVTRMKAKNDAAGKTTAGAGELEAPESAASSDNRKFQAVLRLAAEKSGWGTPMPAGQGRGIACCLFGKTYIAQVAEIAIEPEGTLRVQRVVSAVDCGLAVNPDSVRAQVEGGINFAMTPLLSGEITIKEGAVEQSNFHNYLVLRMKDAPDIQVYLMPGGAEPAHGVGEAGVPPLAPAVANAIFAATGRRVRRLPVSIQNLK